MHKFVYCFFFFLQTPPALPAKRIKKPKPNLTLFKHEDCLSRLSALSVSNDDILSNGHDSESSIPPPLPPKKKHSKNHFVFLEITRRYCVKYVEGFRWIINFDSLI